VAVTVTLKLHEAVRASASVAVHETTVDPRGNGAPDGLEHVTGTGGCPPTAVGTTKVTGIGVP